MLIRANIMVHPAHQPPKWSGSRRHCAVSTSVWAGSALARTIPTPVSISAEARACLAALERISHLRQPWPEENDAETWRRAIAAANAHFGPVMAGMEDLPIMRADEERVAGRALCVAVPHDAPGGYVYLDIHGGGLVALGGDLCHIMGRRAGGIVVGGVSAGGTLAAALALRARDEGLQRPRGLLLLTPELDLTESGDTFQTLRGIDVVQSLP